MQLKGMLGRKARWDEAGSRPLPASLGTGQGHAGMRLPQTSSRRRHGKRRTMDSALHSIFSSVSLPRKGLAHAGNWVTFLGDCTGKDPGPRLDIQGYSLPTRASL